MKNTWILCVAVLGISLLLPFSASASTVLTLDTKLSGDTLGVSPTATFQDMTGLDAGKVLLTLVFPQINNDNQFILDWMFNYSGSHLTDLKFSKVSGDSLSDVDLGSNSFQADSKNAFFDIKLEWTSNKQSSNSFVDGTTDVYKISGNGSINASMFNTLSKGYGNTNQQQYYSAIYWDCEAVGWITSPTSNVPEPSTLLLTGVSLLGLAALRLRKTK